MLEAVGFSDQGLVRKNNEDRFFSSAAAGLCVLADGMGGAQGGEMAASLAVAAVTQVVSSKPPSPLLLKTAFQEADRRVREAADSDTSLSGMGTTLVAALETPSGIAVSNIGDSRCWLWDNGQLTLLTADQSWANEVGRLLGLSEEALSVHPLRNALTTAVGVGVQRQVQSRVVPAQAGSLILLSSDRFAWSGDTRRDCGRSVARRAAARTVSRAHRGRPGVRLSGQRHCGYREGLTFGSKRPGQNGKTANLSGYPFPGLRRAPRSATQSEP